MTLARVFTFPSQIRRIGCGFPPPALCPLAGRLCLTGSTFLVSSSTVLHVGSHSRSFGCCGGPHPAHTFLPPLSFSSQMFRSLASGTFQTAQVIHHTFLSFFPSPCPRGISRTCVSKTIRSTNRNNLGTALFQAGEHTLAKREHLAVLELIGTGNDTVYSPSPPENGEEEHDIYIDTLVNLHRRGADLWHCTKSVHGTMVSAPSQEAAVPVTQGLSPLFARHIHTRCICIVERLLAGGGSPRAWRYLLQNFTILFFANLSIVSIPSQWLACLRSLGGSVPHGVAQSIQYSPTKNTPGTRGEKFMETNFRCVDAHQ